MSKKRKYIIVSIVIAVLLLLLVIIISISKKEEPKIETNPNGVYILPGEYVHPDMVTVTNRKLKKEKCIDDICVSKIRIECIKDQGKVYYQFRNKGKKKKTGYMFLTIDGKRFTIKYNKLKPKEKHESYTEYYNYDLTNAKDYEIEKMTKDDYYRLVVR